MHTILNLSGVYDDEGWLPEGSKLIDLRALEGCFCYCSEEALCALRQAIGAEQIYDIHWIDTGDFHYISKLWLEKMSSPFVLALFDNHPDDEQDSLGAGLLSCGNWVDSARKDIPAMKADYLNTADIPGELPVYLSIDLDVLSPDWARTDWSQGAMTPDELIESVETISRSHRIAGVDICGGLTIAQGAGAADLAVNVRTRNILASYFGSHPPVSG